MKIELIGEYEVTYLPAQSLAFHHVPRGFDVAELTGPAVDELRGELATTLKRIRSIGGCQVIFGAGDDLTIYGPAGQRACYLNPDQVARLRRLLAEP